MGLLNSKTISSVLLMMLVYLATAFMDNSEAIRDWLVGIAPDWLDPAIEHLVAAVGAVLMVLLGKGAIKDHVKVVKSPPQEIKGIWKKPLP